MSLGKFENVARWLGLENVARLLENVASPKGHEVCRILHLVLLSSGIDMSDDTKESIELLLDGMMQ